MMSEDEYIDSKVKELKDAWEKDYLPLGEDVAKRLWNVFPIIKRLERREGKVTADVRHECRMFLLQEQQNDKKEL